MRMAATESAGDVAEDVVFSVKIFYENLVKWIFRFVSTDCELIAL